MNQRDFSMFRLFGKSGTVNAIKKLGVHFGDFAEVAKEFGTLRVQWGP